MTSLGKYSSRINEWIYAMDVRLQCHMETYPIEFGDLISKLVNIVANRRVMGFRKLAELIGYIIRLIAYNQNNLFRTIERFENHIAYQVN